MNTRKDRLFLIHRTTLLVLAVAITFGSLSVYKALGGGSATSVVAGLPTEPPASGFVGRTERSEVPALSNLGSAVLTKADVPRPAVKTTLTPIEQIQVGDRVLAESPTGEEDLQFGSEIIPSDWRKLTLEAPKRDGTIADVVLLRPVSWLIEQHSEVGGTVFISVPECGIDGNAQVLAIDACSEIPSGAGRVVTGTFLHKATTTISLTIAGQSEPIECTGNHPFWSEDRQTFVRADSLHPHETLRTATGLTTVESWKHDLNPTPVYNIEVHGAHVYHVGTSGVVVHNGNLDDCLVTLFHGTDIETMKHSLKGGLLDEAAAAASKIDGPPGFFLADELGDAIYYGARRNGNVLKFEMPQHVLDSLVNAGASFAPIGPLGNYGRHLGNELLIGPELFPRFNELLRAGVIKVTY